MEKKFRLRITDDMIQGFCYDADDYLSDSPTLFVILKSEIYDFIKDKNYKIKLIKQSYGRNVVAIGGVVEEEKVMFEPLRDIFINSVGLYFQFENVTDFTNFKIKHG